MKPSIKFHKLNFRGIPVLITELRIKKEDYKPRHFYYHVRSDDDGKGIPCTIEECVFINHYATIVSAVEIDLPNHKGDRYIVLTRRERNDIDIALTGAND